MAAAALVNTRTISEACVARMDFDAQDISAFFSKFQKPERVRPASSA